MDRDEVYLDKQLVITRTGSPGGLSLSGAIDHYNAEAVVAALTREFRVGVHGAARHPDALAGNGDLHLDVSMLEFTDVTGIRALFRIAEHGSDGRRLVLKGLPAQIRTVTTVIGWANLPNLVMEEDGD